MNEVESLKQLNSELIAKIKEQDEFFRQIMEQPSPYATIAAILKDRVVIASGGGLVEIEKPKKLEIKVGTTVMIAPQTGQPVKVAEISMSSEIATIRTVISAIQAEIDSAGSAVLVFKDPDLQVEAGDRVALDATGHVIVAKLESAAKKYVKKATNVTWNDIGGLEDVKRQLIEIVELPHREPEIFRHYGYEPPKGVLLSGPPGCGKTMLGKATATAIASAHGGESGFIYVKGPEVLNKYVGESEANIRSIFDQARAHKKATNSPAVVFIDEAESLLSRRGTGRSSDMERTIVPAFLAEMDGLEESAAVVILATNRPEQLDPAVVRDGRIDRKVEVKRPDRAGVAQIAGINLARVPAWETTREELVEAIVSELLCESRVLKTVTTQSGPVQLRVRDAISGAMVANVVSRASSEALHRDLREQKRTGVTRADIKTAVDVIQAESARIDHSDEVRELLGAREARQQTNGVAQFAVEAA